MKVSVIIGRLETALKERTEVSIRISPIRFTDGGALMFAAAARNHQNVRDGIRLIIPFVRKRLRVFVVWYERLARTNNIGEMRPWASMVVRAPAHPNLERDRTAAKNRPICATDE